MKIGMIAAVLGLLGTISFSFGQGAKPVAKATSVKAPQVKMMTKADWQKMFDEAEKHFEKEDADGLFGGMTADFSMTMMGQTMGAKEAKEGMKQWFGMVEGLKCDFKVTSFKQKGNTATVVNRFSNTARMMNPTTKKMGKSADSGTETLTFVNVKGKWLVKKIVSNDMKMTLDGKPFTPGM